MIGQQPESQPGPIERGRHQDLACPDTPDDPLDGCRGGILGTPTVGLRRPLR